MSNMMNDVKINDGRQDHVFRGELIGSASSEDGKSLRWSEVEIYRTEGGQYVLVKYGISTVVHVPGAPCSNDKLEISTPAFGDAPCPVCRPSMEPSDEIAVERDRINVHVASTEEGVREIALTRMNGQVFLTKIAAKALLEAFGSTQINTIA